MASFIGGEALARVVSITNTFGTGPQAPATISAFSGYTVPANRYAVLYPLQFQGNNFLYRIDYASGGSNTGLNYEQGITDFSETYYMDEGASFSATVNVGGFNQTVTYDFLILEYNKPDALTLP